MSPTPLRPTPQNVRTTRQPPRGVLQVDWPFFGELCRALALKIFRDYDPELVIGIAKAGAIPGSVVASILQRDFASMTITREAGGSRPVVIAGPPRLVAGRRVLIVDETCDTGDTMKLALAAVRELQHAAVKTAVSFRTGDFKPDFYALESENFIILPWDREVIVAGEIVMRPDYAEKLRDLAEGRTVCSTRCGPRAPTTPKSASNAPGARRLRTAGGGWSPPRRARTRAVSCARCTGGAAGASPRSPRWSAWRRWSAAPASWHRRSGWTTRSVWPTCRPRRPTPCSTWTGTCAACRSPRRSGSSRPTTARCSRSATMSWTPSRATATRSPSTGL